MSNQSMDVYFVIMLLLHICIDQGDGHWKEKDRETLRHDIELYRKMAEKIEHEIESFYDEYPEERYKGDNVDRIQYKHVTHKLDRKTETQKQREHDKIEQKSLYGLRRNASNDNPLQHAANIFSLRKAAEHDTIKNTINLSKTSKFMRSKWPTFEDILEAMGKKYDWKNDRWIKVKEKINKQDAESNEITPKDGHSYSEFHEKHKFIYKIVKLSRSKNRRNVVVAVSAVR